MKAKIISSILLFLALAVTVACNRQESSREADASTSSGPSLCSRDDLNDPVISACRATLSVFPRRERQQMIRSGERYTMTIVSEFESRDRWQIEWYDKDNSAGKEIIINPLIYTKDTNGGWQTVSVAARQARINTALSNAGLLTETVVSISTHISGSELLNTLPTTVYESVFDLRVGGKVSATTWIGSDGLTYKQIIKDPAQASTTVTIYEYDPTIKIEAPDVLRQ